MSFDAHKNFAVSLIATPPSPALSGASLVVTSGDGVKFPATPFNAVIWPSGVPNVGNAEIVRVTAISTDTFTITREQESTTAKSPVAGWIIAANITAKAFIDIEAELSLLSSALVTPTFASGIYTVNAALSRSFSISDIEEDGYFNITNLPDGQSLVLKISTTDPVPSLTAFRYAGVAADVLGADLPDTIDTTYIYTFIRFGSKLYASMKDFS
jgi:hypothetical protein